MKRKRCAVCDAELSPGVVSTFFTYALCDYHTECAYSVRGAALDDDATPDKLIEMLKLIWEVSFPVERRATAFLSHLLTAVEELGNVIEGKKPLKPLLPDGIARKEKN